MDTIQKIYLVIAAFLLICFGWLLNIIYDDIVEMSELGDKKFDGLWINNENINHSDVLNMSYNYDPVGDWICVNIKGMGIKEMVSTCEHEVAHEIFAEKCSSNFTKCLESVGGLS